MKCKHTKEESLLIASDSLRLEYARKLALFELELGTGSRFVEEPEARKVQEYAMSTILRRNFVMRCTVAALEGVYIQVGKTRKLLGTSRAALDIMINECEEAGWISVRRNKQNYRSIQATKIVVECWMDYSDFVTQLSVKHNLQQLRTTAQNISDLLHTK